MKRRLLSSQILSVRDRPQKVSSRKSSFASPVPVLRIIAVTSNCVPPLIQSHTSVLADACNNEFTHYLFFLGRLRRCRDARAVASPSYLFWDCQL